MFRDIQQLLLKELESQNAEKSSVDRVKNAKTLFELEITPADAVEILENNGITPVLDDSDCMIYEHPRHFQSKNDLITVRKTDVVPVNNRLSTHKENKVMKNQKITLDGQEYEYSYHTERNTVHFALNGEVSSHEKGNWDKTPYAILQPFIDIPIEKVASVTSNDTYTRGGIDLTQNAWILCPIDEVEKIKKQNSNVHVLGYVGESVKGLVNPFLSQLGYCAEEVGEKTWNDGESNQQLNDLINKEHLNSVQHYSSTDGEDEDFLIQTNKAIAIIKMFSENHLIKSPKDYERLKPQLETTGFENCFYNIMQRYSDSKQKNIDNTAIIANHRNIEVLSDKMARAGMPLNPNEIDALQKQITDYWSEKARAIRKENDAYQLAKLIMLNSGVRSFDKENQCVMGDVTTPQVIQPDFEQEYKPTQIDSDSMVLW